MTKNNSPTTPEIIKRIHLLLADTDTGEEIIDFLRASEPVFMKEVGQFVQIELDKLKKDFDEEFLLYVGSVIGAAYIMGFLIAREVDHEMYDGLINYDSSLPKSLGIKNIDKIIDDNLKKGKNHKEIGKIIKSYFNSEKKEHKTSKKSIIHKKTPKSKRKKVDVDFDEKEL